MRQMHKSPGRPEALVNNVQSTGESHDSSQGRIIGEYETQQGNTISKSDGFIVQTAWFLG